MIFSIGHSTLDEASFLKALRGRVSTVIDVRSHPTSRWPQFHKESLEKWLPESGVSYEWDPRLGGWDKRHLPLADAMVGHGVDVACYARGKFPKQRIAAKILLADEHGPALGAPSDSKPVWTSQGLYDFSWFMSLPEFVSGALALRTRGETEDVAIMCCEGPWYKCHRSMISDFLVYAGSDALHLPGKKMHSQMIGNRIQRYDDEIVSIWKDLISPDVES